MRKPAADVLFRSLVAAGSYRVLVLFHSPVVAGSQRALFCYLSSPEHMYKFGGMVVLRSKQVGTKLI